MRSTISDATKANFTSSFRYFPASKSSVQVAQLQLTWADEQLKRRTNEHDDEARDDSADSWSASAALEAQLHPPKRRCEVSGEGIGLLLIMWRSSWTWSWNAGCEEVMQQQLISDVYHAWAVFKVGKTVENITPNIRSFIWRERWAISELCLTLIMRRVINTQTIRPLQR